MQRTEAAYRLSPNEEALILKKEKDRRRKLRIQQVREQERQFAKQIRNQVNGKREREVRILAGQLEQDWLESKLEKQELLKEAYRKTLETVGKAHIAADELPPYEEIRDQAKPANEKKARYRGRQAIQKQLDENDKRLQEEFAAVMTRKTALEIERARAALIAKKPNRQSDLSSEESEAVPEPHRVLHQEGFSTSHYNVLPAEYAEKAEPTEQGDAKEDARREEDRLTEEQQERSREQRERQTKAALRQKHAHQKERLKRDYEKLQTDLGQMEQADRRRRQLVVSSIPKQIFEPPHKRLEEKEENQKDMEQAFENMYMANTDYAGDIELALEPSQPPAETVLDVSSDTPGEEFQVPEPRRFPRGLDQTRPAKKDTLKRLLQKVHIQRQDQIARQKADLTSSRVATQDPPYRAPPTDTPSTASQPTSTLSMDQSTAATTTDGRPTSELTSTGSPSVGLSSIRSSTEPLSTGASSSPGSELEPLSTGTADSMGSGLPQRGMVSELSQHPISSSSEGSSRATSGGQEISLETGTASSSSSTLMHPLEEARRLRQIHDQMMKPGVSYQQEPRRGGMQPNQFEPLQDELASPSTNLMTSVPFPPQQDSGFPAPGVVSRDVDHSPRREPTRHHMTAPSHENGMVQDASDRISGFQQEGSELHYKIGNTVSDRRDDQHRFGDFRAHGSSSLVNGHEQIKDVHHGQLRSIGDNRQWHEQNQHQLHRDLAQSVSPACYPPDDIETGRTTVARSQDKSHQQVRGTRDGASSKGHQLAKRAEAKKTVPIDTDMSANYLDDLPSSHLESVRRRYPNVYEALTGNRPDIQLGGDAEPRSPGSGLSSDVSSFHKPCEDGMWMAEDKGRPTSVKANPPDHPRLFEDFGRGGRNRVPPQKQVIDGEASYVSTTQDSISEYSDKVSGSAESNGVGGGRSGKESEFRTLLHDYQEQLKRLQKTNTTEIARARALLQERRQQLLRLYPQMQATGGMSGVQQMPASSGLFGVQATGALPNTQTQQMQISEDLSGGRQMRTTGGLSGVQQMQTDGGMSITQQMQTSEGLSGVQQMRATGGLSGTRQMQATGGLTGVQQMQTTEGLLGVQRVQATGSLPETQQMQATAGLPGEKEKLPTADLSGTGRVNTTVSTLETQQIQTTEGHFGIQQVRRSKGQSQFAQIRVTGSLSTAQQIQPTEALSGSPQMQATGGLLKTQQIQAPRGLTGTQEMLATDRSSGFRPQMQSTGRLSGTQQLQTTQELPTSGTEEMQVSNGLSRTQQIETTGELPGTWQAPTTGQMSQLPHVFGTQQMGTTGALPGNWQMPQTRQIQATLGLSRTQLETANSGRREHDLNGSTARARGLSYSDPSIPQLLLRSESHTTPLLLQGSSVPDVRGSPHRVSANSSQDFPRIQQQREHETNASRPLEVDGTSPLMALQEPRRVNVSLRNDHLGYRPGTTGDDQEGTLSTSRETGEGMTSPPHVFWRPVKELHISMPSVASAEQSPITDLSSHLSDLVSRTPQSPPADPSYEREGRHNRGLLTPRKLTEVTPNYGSDVDTVSPRGLITPQMISKDPTGLVPPQHEENSPSLVVGDWNAEIDPAHGRKAPKVMPENSGEFEQRFQPLQQENHASQYDNGYVEGSATGLLEMQSDSKQLPAPQEDVNFKMPDSQYLAEFTQHGMMPYQRTGSAHLLQEQSLPQASALQGSQQTETTLHQVHEKQEQPNPQSDGDLPKRFSSQKGSENIVVISSVSSYPTGSPQTALRTWADSETSGQADSHQQTTGALSGMQGQYLPSPDHDQNVQVQEWIGPFDGIGRGIRGRVELPTELHLHHPRAPPFNVGNNDTSMDQASQLSRYEAELTQLEMTPYHQTDSDHLLQGRLHESAEVEGSSIEVEHPRSTLWGVDTLSSGWSGEKSLNFRRSEGSIQGRTVSQAFDTVTEETGISTGDFPQAYGSTRSGQSEEKRLNLGDAKDSSEEPTNRGLLEALKNLMIAKARAKVPGTAPPDSNYFAHLDLSEPTAEEGSGSTEDRGSILTSVSGGIEPSQALERDEPGIDGSSEGRTGGVTSEKYRVHQRPPVASYSKLQGFQEMTPHELSTILEVDSPQFEALPGTLSFTAGPDASPLGPRQDSTSLLLCSTGEESEPSPTWGTPHRHTPSAKSSSSDTSQEIYIHQPMMVTALDERPFDDDGLENTIEGASPGGLHLRRRETTTLYGMRSLERPGESFGLTQGSSGTQSEEATASDEMFPSERLEGSSGLTPGSSGTQQLEDSESNITLSEGPLSTTTDSSDTQGRQGGGTGHQSNDSSPFSLSSKIIRTRKPQLSFGGARLVPCSNDPQRSFGDMEIESGEGGGGFQWSTGEQLPNIDGTCFGMDDQTSQAKLLPVDYQGANQGTRGWGRQPALEYRFPDVTGMQIQESISKRGPPDASLPPVSHDITLEGGRLGEETLQESPEGSLGLEEGPLEDTLTEDSVGNPSGELDPVDSSSHIFEPLHPQDRSGGYSSRVKLPGGITSESLLSQSPGSTLMEDSVGHPSRELDSVDSSSHSFKPLHPQDRSGGYPSGQRLPDGVTSDPPISHSPGSNAQISNGDVRMRLSYAGSTSQERSWDSTGRNLEQGTIAGIPSAMTSVRSDRVLSRNSQTIQEEPTPIGSRTEASMIDRSRNRETYGDISSVPSFSGMSISSRFELPPVFPNPSADSRPRDVLTNLPSSSSKSDVNTSNHPQISELLPVGDVSEGLLTGSSREELRDGVAGSGPSFSPMSTSSHFGFPPVSGGGRVESCSESSALRRAGPSSSSESNAKGSIEGQGLETSHGRIRGDASVEFGDKEVASIPSFSGILTSSRLALLQVSSGIGHDLKDEPGNIRKTSSAPSGLSRNARVTDPRLQVSQTRNQSSGSSLYRTEDEPTFKDASTVPSISGISISSRFDMPPGFRGHRVESPGDARGSVAIPWSSDTTAGTGTPGLEAHTASRLEEGPLESTRMESRVQDISRIQGGRGAGSISSRSVINADVNHRWPGNRTKELMEESPPDEGFRPPETTPSFSVISTSSRFELPSVPTGGYWMEYPERSHSTQGTSTAFENSGLAFRPPETTPSFSGISTSSRFDLPSVSAGGYRMEYPERSHSTHGTSTAFENSELAFRPPETTPSFSGISTSSRFDLPSVSAGGYRMEYPERSHSTHGTSTAFENSGLEFRVPLHTYDPSSSFHTGSAETKSSRRIETLLTGDVLSEGPLEDTDQQSGSISTGTSHSSGGGLEEGPLESTREKLVQRDVTRIPSFSGISVTDMSKQPAHHPRAIAEGHDYTTDGGSAGYFQSPTNLEKDGGAPSHESNRGSGSDGQSASGAVDSRPATKEQKVSEEGQCLSGEITTDSQYEPRDDGMDQKEKPEDTTKQASTVTGILEEPDLTFQTTFDTDVTLGSTTAGEGEDSTPSDSLLSFIRHEERFAHSTPMKTDGQQVTRSPQKASSVQPNTNTNAQDQSEPLTLQEALARHKARFIKASQARQTEVKGQSDPTQPTTFSATLKNWQKTKLQAQQKSKKTSDAKTSTRANKENLAIKEKAAPKTSQDRKAALKVDKERTKRLYNQLEEVRTRQVEADRKKAYAENRRKRKEYEEKMRKKRALKHQQKKN